MITIATEEMRITQPAKMLRIVNRGGGYLKACNIKAFGDLLKFFTYLFRPQKIHDCAHANISCAVLVCKKNNK